MKKPLGFFLALFVLLMVSAGQTNAQSSTGSGTATGSGTLPQTGVETPLLIIGGSGLALFSSGFLFKKLQGR